MLPRLLKLSGKAFDMQEVLMTADRARDRRDWNQASELYALYLEENENNFAIRVQYGHALKESGNISAAEQAYSRALDLNPDDADLLLNFGHLKKIQGDFSAALQFYKRSYAIDKNQNAYNELRAVEQRVTNQNSIVSFAKPEIIWSKKQLNGKTNSNALVAIAFDDLTKETIKRQLFNYFDDEWYYSQYFFTIDKLRLSNETLLDFYMRVGGRIGHDPNAEFSEVIYRQSHRDIYDQLLVKKDIWGYRHYLDIGWTEPNRYRPSKAEAEAVRKVVAQLDVEFLISEYNIDPERYISPVDYYFSNVKDLYVSPSPAFSEIAYRQMHGDVEKAVRAGDLSSGFSHFINTLDKEHRSFLTVSEWAQKQRRDELDSKKQNLERNLPGITHLHAFDVVDTIEFLTKGIDVVFEPGEELAMLVLVPNFLPEILFGGYLAFFEFLQTLKTATGIDLKLVIFNRAPSDVNKSNIMRMRKHGDRRANIFSSVQYIDESRTLRIPKNCKVISYSTETHYAASRIAERLNTIPMFFIQEYEPDFHGNGDMFTLSYNTFLQPHFGIYNSKILEEYFLKDAGMLQAHGADYGHCSFENHIGRMSLSRQEFLEKNLSKRIRRLIFYGRPEQHATRNHFATFVIALREALSRGYFDGCEWEFISVGSLVHECRYPLVGSHKLQILTKMPTKDYTELLHSGDIGVSFISTPHPGIVHFQMANYGLVTLTNVTGARTADWLASQNRNIIGVELVPARIAEGLKAAAGRASDLEARYQNAQSAPYLSKAECLQPAIDAVLTELGFPAAQESVQEACLLSAPRAYEPEEERGARP